MKAPATLQAAYNEAHRARQALLERGELVSPDAMAKALKVTPSGADHGDSAWPAVLGRPRRRDTLSKIPSRPEPAPSHAW